MNAQNRITQSDDIDEIRINLSESLYIWKLNFFDFFGYIFLLLNYIEAYAILFFLPFFDQSLALFWPPLEASSI